MAQVQVIYAVALPSSADGPEFQEPEVEGSFSVDLPGGEKLTFADIKRRWPFAGDFHFRAKVVPKADPSAWVWFTLASDGDSVPLDGVNSAFIRAIPTSHIDGTCQTPLEEEEFAMSSDDYYRWAASRRREPMSVEQFPLSAVDTSSTSMLSKVAGFFGGGGSSTPTPTVNASPKPDVVQQSAVAAASEGDEGSFWSNQAEGQAGQADQPEGTEDGYYEPSGEGQEEYYGGEQGEEDPDLRAAGPGGGGPGRDGVVDLDEQVAAAAQAAREKAKEAAAQAQAALSSAKAAMKGFFGKAKSAVEKASEKAGGQAFPF